MGLLSVLTVLGGLGELFPSGWEEDATGDMRGMMPVAAGAR